MLTSHHTRLRLILLAGTMLGSLAAGSGFAQDATWTGAVSNDFHDAGNWNPSGTPAGTASFGSTGRTMVNIYAAQTLGGFTFNALANSYAIINNSALVFTGAGIVNNSGQLQTLYNVGFVFFANSSAANATIVNGGGIGLSFIDFESTSSAGTAAIFNNTNGSITFSHSSTGGNATVNNNAGGTLQFANTSSAGNATITNSGRTNFFHASSAGNATITNNASAFIIFNQTSTAGNATISNSGEIRFFNSSGAGNARLITHVGGSTEFGMSAGPNGDGKLSAGSIAGAGSYGLGSNELTVGGNGDTTEVSGVISGAGGSLVKTGAGTLTLSGINTYTGGTTISDGRLVVNGALASSTVTVQGGILGGSGTVGGIVANVGGTVAPGNSIGTLNVAGNVSFGSGSIYQVEVNAAGQSDRIAATGTVMLNGGTVQVLNAPGSQALGQHYTILTAGGGVTGSFAGLTQAAPGATPFLSFGLVYDLNAVYLDVGRSSLAFAAVGQTPNQISAGRGLDSLPPASPLASAVAGLDVPSARAAFDQLSGEVHASARGVMIEDSRFVREAALDRLRAAFDAIGAARAPVTVYAADGPAFAAPTTNRFAVWARAFGAWGSASSDGNAATLRRDIGGFFVGGDGLVAEAWRLGLLGGYSRSNFRIANRNSSGASDNYHFGLYAGTQWGDLAFRSGAAITWHDITTGRSVAFPGFADGLKGKETARTGQVFGELGYAIRAGRFAFEPFANLAYVNLATDGVTERGAAAALTVRGNTTGVTFTTLGLRTASQFALDNGVSMTARGVLGWRHAFGDVTPLATVAFAGGTPFTIAGLPVAIDAAVVEAGLDFNLTPSATLGLSYGGQFSSRLTDQSVRGNVAWKF
jgi:outer membrane autotransporter protein